MEETYRGVKIKIIAGSLRDNKRGKFELSWPGHEPEEVESQWKQERFILLQAKEFVDQWLADGYITIEGTK